MDSVRFYFSFCSPYAWLAFHSFLEVFARTLARSHQTSTSIH